MTTAEAVHTERRGHVLLVRIDRPDARNAIDRRVSDGVADALIAADADPGVRAIVLTGSGDAVFCAGADLKALAAGEDVVSTAGPRAAYGLGGCTAKTSRAPLIVAANGSAYGGGFEMILAADVSVVERGTRFALPEVARGIIAAAGGIHRLPVAAPRAVAMDLLLTGEPISAERAVELGLCSRLAERGEALSTALALAERIAANAPLAVAETKRLARRLVDGRNPDEARDQAASDAAFTAILATADAAEGARAFAEKRTPVWEAR